MKKYPFNEGDTYYCVHNLEVIESCWDEFSEEAYDASPERNLYSTREGACIGLTDVAHSLRAHLRDVVEEVEELLKETQGLLKETQGYATESYNGKDER